MNSNRHELPKRYILTHVGHKRISERVTAKTVSLRSEIVLLELLKYGVKSYSSDGVNIAADDVCDLDALVRECPEEVSIDRAKLMYSRNPLEHIKRINYEITTKCNFTCSHCRNGNAEAYTETDQVKLRQTADLFLYLGIRRYDFIGGEVSKYGADWLGLAKYISDQNASLDWPESLAINLYTNGWWLGKANFEAAGENYQNEAEYLRRLKEAGVTHIVISVDGPEIVHDKWRKSPGLYKNILGAIPRIQQASLQPRLSIVVKPHDTFDYLEPFAKAIYGVGGSIAQLRSDPFNHSSNLIDAGRAVSMRQGLNKLSAVHPQSIRCKAFYRPAPTLRIMANGELGICTLMNGKEGYGNIHDYPIATLLNNLHRTKLYRLHSTGKIAEHLSSIDPAVFGDRYDHICSVRVAANRCALGSA